MSTKSGLPSPNINLLRFSAIRINYREQSVVYRYRIKSLGSLHADSFHKHCVCAPKKSELINWMHFVSNYFQAPICVFAHPQSSRLNANKQVWCAVYASWGVQRDAPQARPTDWLQRSLNITAMCKLLEQTLSNNLRINSTKSEASIKDCVSAST